MKIDFNTSSIMPMFNWLEKRKNGINDEKELRDILLLSDYEVEFKRYGLEGLPVCNISFDEAVDFFLNFDKKDFKNERLQYKKETFIKFYNSLDSYKSLINMYSSITDEDCKVITSLLKNSLPDKVFNDDIQYNILLIISIGNSMGWPYENYIDFDVANLTFIENIDSFLHIIAHEIHHTMFSELMPEDDMTSQDYFLLNFAFEGLPVHFNNNAYIKYKDVMLKESKYNYDMYVIDKDNWNIYSEDFESLFIKFKEDYLRCKNISYEDVSLILKNEYEVFNYTSKSGKKIRISHYPTYFIGCYFYGIIDLVYGKERLYDCLKNPDELVITYNDAVKEKFKGNDILNLLIMK